MNPLYVAALQIIEARLCPEALTAFKDHRLCVANADCLARHSHEHQRTKLEAAMSQAPVDFVPHYMLGHYEPL